MPMSTSSYGRNLSAMQGMLLDGCSDDERRAAARGRFVAGNAPHPFEQVRMWSPAQRLCGLPDVALSRALADEQGLDRYTGIVASHILGMYHNFSSGGHSYSAYAAQFGDQCSDLGSVDMSGRYDSGAYDVRGGRWEKVQPFGVHTDVPWGFVWVDAVYTHLGGTGMAKVKGLAVDARTVPVVFRVNVHAGGEPIAHATVTDFGWAMRDRAENVRVHFAEVGVPDAVVTYYPA